MKKVLSLVLIVALLVILLPQKSYASFSYYKSITLDHTQTGATNSTNWPLTIGLDGNIQAADTDLKTTGNGGFVQSSSGYDIRPYSDSALTSPLTFELVYYDGATGKLEMHVNIPTLSHSADTVIYLAFGDASISTDGSSTATWNANYKGVWHLPNGASLTANDSTSQANNGTNHSASAAAGEIDGGASFTATTQYIDMGVANPIGGATATTISAWVKYSGLGLNRAIISKWGGASSDAQFLLMEDDVTNSELSFYVEGGGLYAGQRTTNASLTTSTWYLIDATWSATNTFTISINGVAKSLSSILNQGTTALASPGSNFYLGEEVAETRSALAGTMDEARISNIALSADWITSDYNSQKASSTFIVWGTKVATVAVVATVTLVDVRGPMRVDGPVRIGT